MERFLPDLSDVYVQINQIRDLLVLVEENCVFKDGCVVDAKEPKKINYTAEMLKSLISIAINSLEDANKSIMRIEESNLHKCENVLSGN